MTRQPRKRTDRSDPAPAVGVPAPTIGDPAAVGDPAVVGNPAPAVDDASHIQSFAEEPGDIAEGVRVLLFQSVRELLFNTVKHAGVKEASVGIERRKGKRVRVVVEDRGVGFDPAILKVRPGEQGGMGLFSIRERVQLLGGGLGIDSVPGRGTRVAIEVPVGLPKPKAVIAAAELATALAEKIGVERPIHPRRPEGVKTIRVVLVDDHQIVRTGLAELLRQWPEIEVVGEAADGEGGIDRVRELRPDVVVMDVTMPGMNGVEATRRLREEAPGVRVIGLSMHGEAEMGESMRRAGAVEFLSKDGPVGMLVEAIRRAAGEGGAG